MAKKKDKAKKPKGKRIKVSRARKKPRASKKKGRKGRKGQGQYSNLFPTNRQVDSNQYWQLRAEIAGAEARVRSNLKDRKDEESKSEKRAEEKVGRLEQQVQVLAATPPVLQAAPNITIGQPNITVGTPTLPGQAAQSPAQSAVARDEYSSSNGASIDRDNASDKHHVDLTHDQTTPPRAPEPEAPPSPVPHRGETFEEQEQRKQQQLRDATKFRQQSKLRNLGNMILRWKTVSDTAIASNKLQQENQPQTPHNLHVTSSQTDTPTRQTVDSVVETGAPPASAAKRVTAKKKRRQQFALSEVDVSPLSDVQRTASADGGNEYRMVSAAEEAAAARGGLFPSDTFSQEARAASEQRDYDTSGLGNVDA